MSEPEAETPEPISHAASMSPRRAAVIAGAGLLAMTVVYFAADYLIFQTLVVEGDAETTANNIAASLAQYRAGIVGFLIVLVLDVVVAWALYVFFEPVHRALSLLTAWLRLTYAVLLGVALLNLIVVSTMLGDELSSASPAAPLAASVTLQLHAFRETWAFALIVFSLHLLMLGYVAYRSGYVPKLLAALVMAAGLSYAIEYLVKLLVPGVELPVSMVAGWGELIFAFWLVWTGGGLNRSAARGAR